jgi:Ca2+-binding RTX toxin-like protein
MRVWHDQDGDTDWRDLSILPEAASHPESWPGTSHTVTGTAGNDYISFTAQNMPAGYNFVESDNGFTDILPGAGSDIIYVANGDVIEFGANFSAGDQIIGDGNSAEIVLDGNYLSALTITGHMMQGGIGNILLQGGFAYHLVFADSAITRAAIPGDYFPLDLSTMSAGGSATIDAGAERDVPFEFTLGPEANIITGTHLDDVITTGTGTNVVNGGAGRDQIEAWNGTVNTLHGNAGDDGIGVSSTSVVSAFGDAGNDTISCEGALNPNFHFDGGAGNDSIEFLENPAGRTLLTSQNVTSLEGISFALDGGRTAVFDYAIDDSVTGAGHTFRVDMYYFDPSAPTPVDFDASQVSSFHIDLVNGGGLVHIVGGADSDTFEFRDFAAGSTIDGGAGNDAIELDGNVPAGFTFADDTIQNVEKIVIGRSEHLFVPPVDLAYKVVMADGNVAPGAKMSIDGSTLDSYSSLTFDGSKETDGRFTIKGSFGNDVLTGGAGNDAIAGGNGSDHIYAGPGGDHLTGGGGKDVFLFGNVHISTGAAFNTIEDFDSANDSINIHGTVNAIDAAVTGGVLTGVLFDTQLAAAVGASQLAALDAVLFTPDSGAYAGRTFLVVDGNGVAGYQAGHDLVICLGSGSDLSALSAADFT